MRVIREPNKLYRQFLDCISPYTQGHGGISINGRCYPCPVGREIPLFSIEEVVYSVEHEIWKQLK